jgi:putative ABC transport system ATP-binding protein
MLKMESIHKVYDTGKVQVHALTDVCFQVAEGEFVAIIGPSGSGKSTLMNLIGCLDTPTSGTYYLDGQDVSKMTDSRLAVVRNFKIGFVFQSFHLIPKLSALENVELPLVYRGLGGEERRSRAVQALAQVGLEDRVRHKSVELSGGQQQRVAIARALAGDPPLLLADEPTGNLDSASGKEVLKILGELNDKGRTIVLITHDQRVADRAGRTVRIEDGRMFEEGSR